MRSLLQEYNAMLAEIKDKEELSKAFLLDKIQTFIFEQNEDWVHSDDCAEFCVNMGIVPKIPQ